MINLEAEYNAPDAWQRWLPDGRRLCPRSGALMPRSERGKDGTEHRAYFRMVEVDPLEQTIHPRSPA